MPQLFSRGVRHHGQWPGRRLLASAFGLTRGVGPSRSRRPADPPQRRRRTLAVGLLCVLAAQTALRTQENERSLFVSVLDEAGIPVLGLPPTEFFVEEDGQEREVLRVAPAQSPMQVAVLVDTSGAAAFATRDVRNGLETVVSTLHDGNEIALVTFGGPPRILVESTGRLNRLRDGIGRVFAFSDSAAYLLDALVETARGFTRRESSRPVIIVVTTEGLDYSRASSARVLDALQEAHAAAHVFVLKDRTNTALRPGRFGPGDPTALYQRDLTLARIPVATGGQRRDLLLSSALDDALGTLAAMLMNQYELVYARPASLIPPETISVRMRRDGLTAHGTPARRTGDSR